MITKMVLTVWLSDGDRSTTIRTEQELNVDPGQVPAQLATVYGAALRPLMDEVRSFIGEPVAARESTPEPPPPWTLCADGRWHPPITGGTAETWWRLKHHRVISPGSVLTVWPQALGWAWEHHLIPANRLDGHRAASGRGYGTGGDARRAADAYAADLEYHNGMPLPVRDEQQPLTIKPRPVRDNPQA